MRACGPVLVRGPKGDKGDPGERGPAGWSPATSPRLDLTRWPGVFERQPTGSGASVVQTIGWDSVGQCWYTGQRNITATDLGQIMVSRLTRDGSFQDAMVIAHAGHALIGVERTGDAVFLWVGGEVTDDLARALTRIPYTAGATVDAATYPVLSPRRGAYRVSASVDPVHRMLAVRWQTNNVSSPTSDAYLDLYELDAAAEGVFEPVASIPHPSLPSSMQGFTSLGMRAYDYWGVAEDLAGPLVRVFDWTTGALLDSQAVGVYPGLRPREPEGLCVYDQAGMPTRATIAFGFTGGASGQRDYSLARFPFPGTLPWTLVDYDETVFAPNSPNYVPQYLLDGDRVHLHFSLSRTDGQPWTNVTPLFTLPPEARPNRTQRLVGVCGSLDGTASTVRFEVSADGTVTVFDGRDLTVWIGADCQFWRC